MIIPLIKPRVCEEEVCAVADVIRSTWINEGKKVAEFEETIARYVGTRYAVAFFNGTVALHAALTSLGIGTGDEVIVPSFTFFSTVSSVIHAGASPVFADVTDDAFCLDPADIEKKISKRTKALIPVHYGGCPADMAPIMKIAADNGLMVIEDAAESLGASYRGKPVGSFGRAAMFSFTPTKVITTGEGGILSTDDGNLAERLRLLKNHGQDQLYHHVCIGYNYRMTELQAAMGLVQFRKLPDIISEKRRVALRISAALRGSAGLRLPAEPPDRFHTYMLYTIVLENREARDILSAKLAKEGVTTRIYFPPVHLQPVFRDLAPAGLPVTERLGETCLSLPCYASMSDEEIEYMANRIKHILKEIR